MKTIQAILFFFVSALTGPSVTISFTGTFVNSSSEAVYFNIIGCRGGAVWDCPSSSAFQVGAGQSYSWSRTGYANPDPLHDELSVVWYYPNGDQQIYSTTLSGFDQSISLGTHTYNPSPGTTNYTFSCKNTLLVPARATWKFNGSVAKVTNLNPGQTDTFTTPTLSIGENFTCTVNVTAIPQTVTYNDDGGMVFTNLSYSGSAGPTSNVAGDGGVWDLGTFQPSSNGAFNPSTNSIVWGTPTGAASESTLQKGFATLHQDNSDLLNGISILNSNAFYQTLRITNALGQIEMWTRSNNDALFHLASVLTNLPSSGSTNLATEATQVGVSNIMAKIYDLNSNFWGLASEFVTNSVSTNDFAEFMTNAPTLNTNFAELTGIYTNPVLEGFFYGFTNYNEAKAAGDAMSAETGLDQSENKLTEFLTGMVDFSSELYDYWPEVPMTFSFSPYLSGGALGRGIFDADSVIDFDPLHYDWGAEMFSLVRRLLMWLATFWFLMRIVEDAWKIVFLINNSSNIDRASLRQYVREKK